MEESEEKRINDRFERIEKNLDSMLVTTKLLDRAEIQHEKWRSEFEHGLDRIQRACDFIASSQISVWEALHHLVNAFDAHRKNPYGHGGDEEKAE